MKSKIFLMVLSTALIAGCGGSKPVKPGLDPTPVIVEVKVPYLCGQPPPVDVVIMRDINWDIITLDDVDLFTLTVADYQALGMNTSDWIAASRQMKAQRDFYRDCIVRSRQEIQDENVDAGLVPSVPTE
jgi:hypothetical protein